MANLCIIPARGGSKRILRKNIKDFLGKPIIAYSIEAALQSGLFDEVMVSTDDEEIADVASHYGAKIPFLRSLKNADDLATTADVLIEVIEKYMESGLEFNNLCCIYPTAPLVDLKKLLQGFYLLKEGNVDSVLPIVNFDYTIWRSLKKNDSGYLELNWKEFSESRSQDLLKVYHDAGQWYWIKTDSLLNNKNLFTDKTKGIELNPLEVQDIDTYHDWKIAELKYEYLQSIK
jgi:N-acylneuraminate cytidylyltransferase